jgi:signal transduction histidine kinase
MRAQDPNFNVTIERDYQDDVGEVTLVPQDIGRVLLNILGNAFYAIQAERRDVKSDTDADSPPTVWVSTASPGDQVTITIRDSGPGIPEDILKKVFEPFFTTKPTGDGTGLGLSLSHEIVTKGHGGSLVVENAAQGGARFVISLPRSPKTLT